MSIESDSLGYVSLAVAFGAVAVSVITFLRKQKSEQFRIALDINNRLEENVNQLLNTEKDTPERRSYSLQYLNSLEFLSFLINKGEIKNKNIIEFFKPRLMNETKRIFDDYPDIANDEKAFEEIKKLRKKL